MRLNTLIDLFLEDVCGAKTNETPTAYRRKLNCFVRWMGDCQARKLTPHCLKQFKAHLQKRRTKRRGSARVPGPLSPFTIRSVLVTLKHFCRWLNENGYLKTDPAQNLRVPQPPAPDPKPVSAKTVTALIQAARRVGQRWEQARNLALLYCLRDTGGRIGALLNAELDELDLEAGRMVTVSKSKKGTLYLSPPTVATLRAWLACRRDLSTDCYRVFVGRHGRPLTRSGVYWVLKRLAAQTSVTGRCNPHSFRHAFVRDLLQSRQADLSQASRLAWHTSIRVTSEYYARWDDAELQDVHRRASPGLSLPMPELL